MQKDRMTTFRRIVALAFALPVALALAACGGGSSDGEAPKGEPVAAVPPPAGKQWSEVVAPVADGGMLMGNPNAPIKLTEYGSLSCPHCAKLANDGMPTLIDKYVNSGRVSYEFHSYAIHGVIDLPLTLLVRCTSQDAFFPLVEQIYSDQEAIMTRAEQGNDGAQKAQDLPPNQRFFAVADAFGLIDWFAARGVSKDQAKACLSDTAAAEKFAKETEKASTDLGVNSTPTLMLNGSTLNLTTWKELEPALQNAGAR
jgi:protein-disulfide isomerase